MPAAARCIIISSIKNRCVSLFSHRGCVTGCNSSPAEKLATVPMRHSLGKIRLSSPPFLTAVTAEQRQRCRLKMKSPKTSDEQYFATSGPQKRPLMPMFRIRKNSIANRCSLYDKGNCPEILTIKIQTITI